MEIDHRLKLAREQAGLSLGQAAKILNMERATLEQIEASPETPNELLTSQMAEVYGVNPFWLLGAVPRRDYDAMKDARGYDQLSQNDRDIVAEFAAAMPRGKARTLEAVSSMRDFGTLAAELFPRIVGIVDMLHVESKTVVPDIRPWEEQPQHVKDAIAILFAMVRNRVLL